MAASEVLALIGGSQAVMGKQLAGNGFGSDEVVSNSTLEKILPRLSPKSRPDQWGQWGLALRLAGCSLAGLIQVLVQHLQPALPQKPSQVSQLPDYNEKQSLDAQTRWNLAH